MCGKMASQSPLRSALANKLFHPNARRRPSHDLTPLHAFPSRNPTRPSSRRPPSTTVDFRDWDPDNPRLPPASTSALPPSTTTTAARSLSPIARYIVDSLRRNDHRWGPPVLTDLGKLRRVTPDLVAEVLRFPGLPYSLSTHFFHWAGKQKGYNHSYAAYNALAYSLNRCGQFRTADQVLELMLAQGKPPTEKQFEILIRFHADAGRGLRLHRVYTKMRGKFGVKPRVFLYNRIMDALVKTGHLDLALDVYRDFKEDGLEEERTTFMILAKGLCKGGRIKEALELLGRMRTECCKPDVFAYTAMVKVLMAEGNLDACLRIWEEIGKDGVVPDVMAYKTMIVGLCKAGEVEEANRVFMEMKKRNLLMDQAVYGALVDGFVQDGNVGRGCELLSEMVKDGYRADLQIYDTLIAGLCGIGRSDKAAKLFRVVVQEGLVPGFGTVCPLLVSYAEKEEMELFYGLVVQIGELGLPVADNLVKFFMSFITSEGKALKGADIFEGLKAKGYCSVSIYNVLFESLHKFNRSETALKLFEEMNTSKEYEPDSSTYSFIISCFVENGDVRGACACYSKIKERFWNPSVVAYCSLVKGLCRSGEINAALTIVKDCLGNVEHGPMEFKYTLSVLHACKSGSTEKVIGILNELMEEQGCPPEDILCCAVIHGFCKYSNSKDAKKVLLDLRNRNILTESKLIMYEDMLKEHMMRTTAGLVLSGLKFFGPDSKLKLTSSSKPTNS